MRDLSKILKKSNLKPKDRILLSIHNDISKMKEGKSVLTEADLYSLCENWTPKDSFEAKEYNRYLNVWQALKFLDMDMQTTFLNSVIDIKDIEKIILYFILKTPDKYHDFWKDELDKEDQEKAFSLILKNTGIYYSSALHKMTFDSLPKDLQDDLLALDPESKYEHSYFTDEENLSKIMKDKKVLSKSDVNQIVSLVMDSISWNFEHITLLKERFFIRNLTHSYFAGIPISIFIKRMAKDLGIKYKNDDELKEELNKISNFKEEFKKSVKNEIEEGILFSEYIPLCNSEDFATCNEKDTVLPHNKIIDIWIKEKDKNRELIQKYIDSGELRLDNKCKKVFNTKSCRTSIDGESIYHSKAKLPFVEEYKKQVSKLDLLGKLVLTINKRNFIKNYQYLLYYRDTLKKLSEFFEEDIVFMADKYLKDLDEQIEFIYKRMDVISERMTEGFFLDDDLRYSLDVYVESMLFDKNKLKPLKHECHKIFEDGVKKDFDLVSKT